MSWAEVIAALLTVLEADDALLGLLGGPHVYPSDDPHAGRIPSIAYTDVADAEGEEFDEVMLQWDIFAGEAQLPAIEARLRQLVAPAGPQVLGDLQLLAQFDGGRRRPHPEHGVAHRSFDVRYFRLRA